MTLSGKWFFAAVIQFLMRQAPWTTWAGPKSTNKCPYKRHVEKTGGRGEGSVKMEAETGAMQSQGDGKEWNLPKTLWQDLSPTNTLNLDFFSPGLGEDKYFVLSH